MYSSRHGASASIRKTRSGNDNFPNGPRASLTFEGLHRHIGGPEPFAACTTSRSPSTPPPAIRLPASGGLLKSLRPEPTTGRTGMGFGRTGMGFGRTATGFERSEPVAKTSFPAVKPFTVGTLCDAFSTTCCVIVSVGTSFLLLGPAAQELRHNSNWRHCAGKCTRKHTKANRLEQNNKLLTKRNPARALAQIRPTT